MALFDAEWTLGELLREREDDFDVPEQQPRVDYTYEDEDFMDEDEDYEPYVYEDHVDDVQEGDLPW